MTTIVPKVNETQEFIEIANDFSNPLDIVREAISNAYDAKAKNMWISFETIEESGEKILKVTLQDDGEGMDLEGLQSFFDLGNSLRRNDDEAIGEKGHGTKIYFNSRKIIVSTVKNGALLKAVMDEPFKKLHSKIIPVATVESSGVSVDFSKGTKVELYGYNNNRREKFSHEILKDYILWFTKQGSFEKFFLPDKFKDTSLYLKGLNRLAAEMLTWGHYFPEESENIGELFNKHLVKAPELYCKHVVKKGYLKNFPEIEYHAIFAIEGRRVKYDYNNMIRRSGYAAPEGAYQIQERYGLWLCKDFIPIQRKNEWISSKGSEFTRFHAFFNCQGLKLTANRGSIENTPTEILQDIQGIVRKIYDDIINGDEWTSLTWLEGEADIYQTVEKEKSHYDWRIKKVNRSSIANYKDVVLVEPDRESGVYALTLQLSILEPNLFPFQIVDYDTHEGIDVIAKGDKSIPIVSAKLFYVEFKRTLTDDFNHSFENLHSIVCWDTDIKHDEQVKDIKNEKRKMQIQQPEKKGGHTKFFLDNPRQSHKIEIFVLKVYLKERLNIDFFPRSAQSVV